MLSIIHDFLKRFPDEMATIGRLVAGYGELEYGLARLLATVSKDEASAMKLIFRTRGESGRLAMLDAATEHRMDALGLAPHYKELRDAVRWCRDIRNQYAHAHWMEGKPSCLLFCNMDEAVKGRGTAVVMDFERIGIDLLNEQEAYFNYAYQLIPYLKSSYVRRSHDPKARLRPKPKRVAQPKLHNPTEGYGIRRHARGIPLL